MQRFFNIQNYSSINNIIISVTGMIDTENKIIKRTILLNDISRTEIYNGFNFSVALDDIVPKENLFLVNDAFSTGIGISKISLLITLTAMVFFSGPISCGNCSTICMTNVTRTIKFVAVNFLLTIDFLTWEPASADVVNEENIKCIVWSKDNLKRLEQLNQALLMKLQVTLGKDLTFKLQN